MKAAEQELFRRYLSGEMSGEERLGFEERLAGDKVFREDYELYVEMEGFVEERVEKGRALEVLREVGNEERGVSNDKNLGRLEATDRRKWLWMVVGVAVVSLAAVFILKNNTKDRHHQELLAQYEYPPNRGTRSLEIATTKLDSAIHYFDLRRMEESEKLFLGVLAKDSLHQDANRYMGHISFLRGDIQKCSFYFNSLDSLYNSDKILID